MQNILSDTSKFSTYVKDLRIKNNPFIVAQAPFNRKLIEITNKGEINNSKIIKKILHLCYLKIPEFFSESFLQF